VRIKVFSHYSLLCSNYTFSYNKTQLKSQPINPQFISR